MHRNPLTVPFGGRNHTHLELGYAIHSASSSLPKWGYKAIRINEGVFNCIRWMLKGNALHTSHHQTRMNRVLLAKQSFPSACWDPFHGPSPGKHASFGSHSAYLFPPSYPQSPLHSLSSSFTHSYHTFISTCTQDSLVARRLPWQVTTHRRKTVRGHLRRKGPILKDADVSHLAILVIPGTLSPSGRDLK